MRFEYQNEQDPPEMVMAEALQSIAYDLNRIADMMEDES